MAEKTVILQHIDLPFLLTDQLTDDFEVLNWITDPREEIERRASEFTVLLSSGEDKVDAETIKMFPNLELIANFGVGYDGVDVDTATELGIRVSNTPDVVTDDVADLTVGFLVMLSRELKAAERHITENKWNTGPYSWSHKVAGSSVGIVGMGRIGRAVAKRLAVFDIDIHYTDVAEIPSALGTYHANIIDLANSVTTLVVTVPGGDQTRKLINKEVLDALGPNGQLINVARGSLVDQAELVAALSEKRLGAAALDVFEDEPQVPAELIGKDNVIVTPHIGTATWETRQTMSDLVVANIRSWLKDRTLVTPVN